MTWKVGVLIIGSLFWRMEPHRVAWRKSRLNESKPIPVFAPIRYASVSSQDSTQMGFAHDHEVIEALAPDRSDQPFCKATQGDVPIGVVSG
jgi:hypothetical protein